MNERATNTTEHLKQSFREESREILVDLESALLELNECRNDADLVGRVFRALHTIKGSGSMFGFEKLARFTHNLETAYDEVRNGRLEISSELIDLTLVAMDQIRAMLDEDDAQASAADTDARARILDQVRQLSGMAQNEREEAAHDPAAGNAPPAIAKDARPEQEWCIRFAPGPDLLRYGANPLLLLRELGELGALNVNADMTAIPPLVELDPERCYIAWDLTLRTAADRDAIRDVFIFVEDSCEVAIWRAGNSASEIASSLLQQDSAADAACEADMTAKALDEQRAGTGGRRIYDKPDNASSLRVPAVKLDQLVDLVGEMVTVQARLSELASRSDDSEITAVSEEIERLTSALRESSMNIRMTPIRCTFEKFRRLVHDLARDLSKNVDLTIEGADTELDKTVIDQLGDPLMHLIRNSMDHGIETSDLRITSGKPATATIHLSARHSGANVLVTVTDDGRGIDADAVHRRAVERGIISAEAQLTESQIFALIFEPGFSTAKQVTDVSGRGVGMDVVRQRVESLRGAVEVQSKPGKGTSVTLRLPLTMAIIDGLLVGVDDACFVLPLGCTLECIELTREDVARANGKHIANVRGELVPYIRLREHFRVRSVPPEIEQIMLVETAEGRFGFVVDRVLGNCQTVIKSLGRVYRHVQAVSGATILGNGTVALILDPDRLVQDMVRDDERGKGGRTSIARVGTHDNSVDFTALAGRGSAGPSASAHM